MPQSSTECAKLSGIFLYLYSIVYSFIFRQLHTIAHCRSPPRYCSKGGALITAELAESYHRDCFAFPGRCNDEYSIGCNNLIRKNQAVLITSAEDLVKAMGWESSPKTEKTVQRELFPDLSEEEERIVKRLGKMPEGLQINTLVIDTNIPVNRMSALLFELEMKGVIRALAGGVYRLIM